MSSDLMLRGACAFALASVSLCTSLTITATPTSANYALPASAVNSGVANIASPNFKPSSSVGDAVYTQCSTGAGCES